MFDFLNGAGERVVERFFLKLIDPFDREDLEDAVRRDVSLLDETAAANPGLLSKAEALARRFRGQRGLLTVENIIEWMKDRRPELYFYLASDPAAHAWIDRQIREFRDFLF